MTNTNEPISTTTYRQTPRNNSSKNIIIGVLAVALIGVTAYLLVDKTKNNEVIVAQESQIAQVTDEKSDVQRSFDESLARLDSMAGVNSEMSNKLTEKISNIVKTKAKNGRIIIRKKLTYEE